ncbi:hypothetical protein JTE90_004935, partial [Oedothorax gibbosus]
MEGSSSSDMASLEIERKRIVSTLTEEFYEVEPTDMGFPGALQCLHFMMYADQTIAEGDHLSLIIANSNFSPELKLKLNEGCSKFIMDNRFMFPLAKSYGLSLDAQFPETGTAPPDAPFPEGSPDARSQEGNTDAPVAKKIKPNSDAQFPKAVDLEVPDAQFQ